MKGVAPLKDIEHFWLRRLHSLSGVIPIGAYLIFHLCANYFAVYGPKAYNIPIQALANFPFTIWLEFGVIYLPLLFHILIGIKIMRGANPNQLQYPYWRNWAYMLQRLSGIVLVFFIGWHMWETRIAKALYGTEINFELMANILQSWWSKTFYVVGITCACFHFANGMATFCIAWGITVGHRSQKAALILFYLLGAILLGMGLTTVFSFTPAALHARGPL